MFSCCIVYRCYLLRCLGKRTKPWDLHCFLAYYYCTLFLSLPLLSRKIITFLYDLFISSLAVLPIYLPVSLTVLFSTSTPSLTTPYITDFFFFYNCLIIIFSSFFQHCIIYYQLHHLLAVPYSHIPCENCTTPSCLLNENFNLIFLGHTLNKLC